MNSLFWFCFAKSEQSSPLALLGVFAKAKLLPKACKQLLCSPFGLVYSNNGKRITRFFETDMEREDFIATHSFLKDEGFKDFLELSPQVITDVVAISKLLPADVGFMDMYKFWHKAHKSIPVMTVFEACDAYVRDMRKIGREESHIVRVRRILESFCDTFGDHYLSSIKKYEIEDWLDSLPYQGQTKQNYKSILTATFNFFLKNDWIEKNIASKLRCEQAKAKEIGILSLSEAERLLRVNEDIDPEITGLIALGLFAGMRSSAISRVECSELNFKDRGTDILFEHYLGVAKKDDAKKYFNLYPKDYKEQN